MRICTALVIVAALAGALPQAALADEVPLGNWTGFRQNPNNNNRQPRQLTVRKVPDPHVAWRGGSGELMSVSFGQNQNNMNEVNAISLSDGRLTFSFSSEDQIDVRCVLLHQPKENTYVGTCTGNSGPVTLSPPAPAKPAAATPAEAK